MSRPYELPFKDHAMRNWCESPWKSWKVLLNLPLREWLRWVRPPPQTWPVAARHFLSHLGIPGFYILSELLRQIASNTTQGFFFCKYMHWLLKYSCMWLKGPFDNQIKAQKSSLNFPRWQTPRAVPQQRQQAWRAAAQNFLSLPDIPMQIKCFWAWIQKWQRKAVQKL